MFLLYDLLLLASAAVLLPYYLLRGVKYGKVRRGVRERLGFYSSEKLAALRGRKVIWVHAVSVGETRAAVPLLKGLRKEYPGCALILSNVTETGHAIARELREPDLCLFFPFDLSWVVRRAFSLIRPSLIVIVETELWPNFVRLARRSGIPVVLVNGRISDRSFPRYRLVRSLIKPVLESISAFCMQSELDARRILQLGAPEERVAVTRNLKFDMQATVPDSSAVAGLRASLRLPAEGPIWVAGSTHAGEEEAVLEVYRRVFAAEHGLLLILVPRHPERCGSVGQMLASRGVSYVLRSSLSPETPFLQAGQVLLVDTVGEMLKFYATADLVFVGGSLVPVGGHNILEASLLKKPVIFGKYVHNFKEISQLLLEVGGGFVVQDRDELASAVLRLLEDPALRLETGERGYSLVEKNAGSTAHTLAVIGRVAGRIE